MSIVLRWTAGAVLALGVTATLIAAVVASVRDLLGTTTAVLVGLGFVVPFAVFGAVILRTLLSAREPGR